MKLSEYKNTVIWGDSVARGVIYDQGRERYTISKRAAAKVVAESTGLQVTNRAHMGMTSVEGEAMMEKDLAKGIIGETALIGFGGNDSDFDWRAISDSPEAHHDPRTPLPVFEETMRRMVKRLREKGVCVIMATLTPVIAERYFDFCAREGLNKKNILAWLGTKEQIAIYHRQYSEAVERIAKEQGCPLIDLYGAFHRQADMGALFCADGAHPNDEGQALIAETVLSALATA